nr:hypothetical protein [uncultured Desulfobacter sp.]
MYLKKLIYALLIMAIASNVHANRVEGMFTAIKPCPAYQSFKKGHNPQDVHVVPGRTYEVVEENKAGGPWALILVPEISNSRRWVAKECGVTKIYETGNDTDTSPTEDTKCTTANTYDSNVLALSWQAGFCEHFNYSGVKPECDKLNSGTISITNITMHGLWPNKNGCGHNYGNCSATPLDLEEETISEIAPWMPNCFYSTEFAKHEWKKHGTCQELSDDDYFIRIQQLAQKFDQSALGKFMRENIGETVQVSEMEKFLVTNLGKVVTKKIELRCTGAGNKFLNEFWINLPKTINVSGSIENLVSGAEDKPNFKGNCAKQIYIEAPGPN